MRRFTTFLIIITAIITIILMANTIHNYKRHIQYFSQKIELLQHQLNTTQNNFFLPLKLKNFNLDSLITNSSILKDKFIMIFPEDICNICYEEVFHHIEKLEKEKKKKIVAIIHTKFKRKFDIYNNKYNLGIENIIYLSKISIPIDDEIILLYHSLNGQIFIPVVLNSEYYEINNYIEIISQSMS